MSVHTQDMDYWPLLISQPPDGAPHDHPQKKTLISALPVLYLRHSKDWRLARPFILAGGLGALSDLLVHENLYLRSQVHTHTQTHTHTHSHMLVCKKLCLRLLVRSNLHWRARVCM